MDQSPDQRKIVELRTFIETHLAKSIRESMEIEYLSHGEHFAVVLGVFGHRFRLEPSDAQTWILMTADEDPKLLDRFEGDEADFQKWLLLAIVDHTPKSGST